MAPQAYSSSLASPTLQALDALAHAVYSASVPPLLSLLQTRALQASLFILARSAPLSCNVPSLPSTSQLLTVQSLPDPTRVLPPPENFLECFRSHQFRFSVEREL